MTKDKPVAPSKETAAKTIFTCFQLLDEAGGEMARKVLLNKMSSTIEFDEKEKELLASNGQPRWLTVFLMYSIDANKAGFLAKDKGTWILTAEGKNAMKLGKYGLIESASKAYRKWDAERKESSKLVESGIPVEELSKEKEDAVTFDIIKQQAQDSIYKHIESLQWDIFQDLVAALLSAMGYYISHVAPKGKDGGIDIIAYTDPLGTKPPRIVVQVKHRPTSTISSDDIQRLSGTMKRESDVGIFVTSGYFSTPAKTEARSTHRHIELIDFERFIDLWIQYYPQMNDKHKNMLPLRPVYFLEINE